MSLLLLRNSLKTFFSSDITYSPPCNTVYWFNQQSTIYSVFLPFSLWISLGGCAARYQRCLQAPLVSVFQRAKRFFYSCLSTKFFDFFYLVSCLFKKKKSSFYILLSGFLPLCTTDSCTGQDLADLGDRLRDWFQLLQGNAKQNNTRKTTAATSASSKTQSSQLSVQPLIWCWTRLHQLTFAEDA